MMMTQYLVVFVEYEVALLLRLVPNPDNISDCELNELGCINRQVTRSGTGFLTGSPDQRLTKTP